MRYVIALLIILSMASVLPAQIIKVVDAENNAPIERATVTNKDNLKYTITNDEGEANLAELGAINKKTVLLITSMGYQPASMPIGTLEPRNNRVSLVASSISLDQVVVSATRWNQSSRELPFEISTISAKDVALQNPQTTADLLGQSGEVFIQKSQQGGGSPMIRGFATNRLLIAVDGIRMNNAIFRSGNLQNVISLDPYSIARTEIYFGPGSVIYGSDAIGGVMSFSTLNPELASGKEVEYSGGMNTRFSSANNEFSKHFDLNVGWEKWALLTSISHFDYGDLQMGSKGPDEYLNTFRVQRIDSTDRVLPNENPEQQHNTGFEQIYLMQKVRFKPNVNWDFTYALHYSETSDYGRTDRLIRTRNGKPRAAQWYYGPQVWQMNYLNISHVKRNWAYDKATLRLAQQLFRESRNDRDFGDPILNQRKEQVMAYSANLDLLKRLSESHKIFYGAEAVYNDVNSDGSLRNINTNDVFDGPDRYPQSNWQSYALYFNHEWEASTKFTTQVGARYNQFMLNADFSNNLDFFPLPVKEARLNKGALTGSAGFVYRPDESWKLRLNLGTAFRSPNIDDIGKVFDSGDKIVVVPNPALNAEYAYNADLGLAKILNKNLKLDLGFYYTYLDQALVRRPFSLAGQDSIIYNGELSQVQAVQNAAQAWVYGFQLGLEWQLANNWLLESTFNYQRGREEMEDGTITPSRHAAPWFGLTRLEYTFKQLRLQAYAQYSGRVSYANLNFEERGKAFIYATNAEGKPYSPGWYTLNFKALYSVNNFLNISAGVENISDIRYRPYSSGIVASGRNVVVAVGIDF